MLLYTLGGCTVESQCIRRVESHQPAVRGGGGRMGEG